MNQNPENFPPIIPAEERMVSAKEAPKGRIGKFFAALRETALIGGIKKAGSWIGAKIGIGVGAAAAGTAVAPGVGTAIGVAVTAVGKVVKGIKSGIVRLVKKPEEAAGWVAGGAIIVSVLPMPIALIGVAFITVGGTALISWGVASAGMIAGGFAAKTTAFFIALTTAPFTAPIALFVIAVLGTLATLTFFIVITTAGAFILPTAPSPRYASPFPPPVIPPECMDLVDLINNIANTYCVPPAILMAISRMEASGVWSWSCEEVAFFSTDRWWEGASQALLDRGYCYDTCARTGLCSGTTVMGPMQFEENTWIGIMPGYDLIDRCNLELSLIAAAKKIKANSGTGPGNCGPWDETTVRYVAYRYCGSCGTYGCQLNPDPNDSCSPACGYDYCSNVWYLYQQYESS